MRQNRLLLFVVLCCPFFAAQAQFKEITLNIGDSLTLGKCPSDSNFTHIDLMVKTRWPNPEATFDTLTGAGFYDWYFDGDIDSRRLPCSFSNMRFRVASVHQYKNEDGSIRTVVFGQLIDKSTVLWVEIQPAIESGEVLP